MRRNSSLFAALVVLAICMQPWAASAAPHNDDIGTSNGGRIDQGLVGAKGTVSIILELADPAATSTFAEQRARGANQAATTAAVQQRINRIDQAQRQLLPALARSNAKIIYRAQRVYNGIALVVDSAKLAELAKLPNVIAIHRLIPKERENSASVPLIGAPELWQGLSGSAITGQGIKVGIIDTGVDYVHTGFGGTGSEEDYAVANDPANNVALTEDVTRAPADFKVVSGERQLYPSTKVVGGFDFAGDDYNAAPGGDQYPKPDANPMDCADELGGGHGSHVGGTAAGYGVNADGSTYTGPYNNSVNLDSLRIGPGVAPLASLYALRVFGCDGSTNLVVPALEWAMDPNGDGNFSDHLDVVNMSLGSSFGAGYDPEAVASDNAVDAGVIVVASAGNSGNTNFITGSPATSIKSISVASTQQSTTITDGFRVNAPADIAGIYPASKSSAYNWDNPPTSTTPPTVTIPLTATLYYPAENQSGCKAWSPAEKAKIAGTIVLVDWRAPGQADFPCGSAGRGANAAAAGAKGIIMVDNVTYLATSIFGSPAIPAMFTVKQVGDALKSQLTAGQPSTVSVTLSNEFANSQKVVSPDLVDTLSDFSSRGPANDGGLKPDIAAPGSNIFSVKSGTGSEGLTLSGTSMAAPHVAGSMALLRQLHPDWTVQQLKALAMNTAIKDVRSAIATDSPIYGPSRVGAGRIDLTNAAQQSVIAYSQESPDEVSLNFGSLEVTNPLTVTKQVTVVNKGTTDATFATSFTSTSVITGVVYTVTPAEVTLAAGQSANVSVTLTADPSQMKHTIDPTLPTIQGTAYGPQPRAWLSEAQGYLTMTPSGAAAATLRLPVHAFARPASDVSATSSSLFPVGQPIDTKLSIKLQGQGVDTGDDTPLDIKSLTSAFELQYTGAAGPSSEQRYQSSKLKYVGVTSTMTSTSVVSETTVYFGIATYGNWATPTTQEVRVLIDVNGDGIDDYLLHNVALRTTPTSNDYTDVFFSELCSFVTGECDIVGAINFVTPDVYDTNLFNTNVMVLEMPAGAIGLRNDDKVLPLQSAFNYRVITIPPGRYYLYDSTPSLNYQVGKPGVMFSDGIEGLPVYLSSNETTIPLTFNSANFAENRSKGVLLLHHHNTNGKRAEAIGLFGSVQVPAPASQPTRLFLPIAGS